ncbi:MAG: DUF4168 domain-containing protein [Elainellaceae cyanobacterium]
MKRLLSRTVLVSLILTGGVLFEGIPRLGLKSSAPQLSGAAYAQQTISNEQVRNYARSVQEIEEIRRIAYAQIRNLSDSGQVPPVACHESDTMRNLNQSIRDIVVDYCTQSIRIVERNNLTITQFNTITATQQSDSGLASRIQDELRRLQSESQDAEPQQDSTPSPSP